MTVDLKEFFGAYDIDSLRTKVLAETGVDIQGVYCLATGKRMGTYDSSEILAAIDEIGTDDEESLIDDLLVRVVASMRPSPAMNMPNRATIREMVATRPVDALAFLANRLHGHRDLLTRRSEYSFQPLIDRISLHRHWSDLAAEGVDLTPWIHWLLEIDAKMNLHDVHPVRIEMGLKGWIRSNVGSPLLTLVTKDNAEDFLKLFESWAFDQLVIYDRRDNELLKQSQWVRGNPMSGPAFVRSWLENPVIANRKAAEAHAKKGKVGRPATSAKKIAQNADVNQFIHLLEGILDGTIETATPATPPKPRVFTGASLKLNLAKKGA